MKLGQVYSTLFNAGQWTIAGGICPYVGAGGHLTGGGEGMLTRNYGLGIDQVGTYPIRQGKLLGIKYLCLCVCVCVCVCVCICCIVDCRRYHLGRWDGGNFQL
jgi:hypothetical protein